MPTWGGILSEINAELGVRGPAAFDFIRRKYLLAAHQKTGRACILYATKWTVPDPGTPSHVISINDGDLQGLMEVINGVPETALDLILHSPGGGLDAAAAIVKYLRTKFTDIRAVVPSAAMSAAGMIACSANRILMGKHSFLGPADPQFTLPTTLGGQRSVAVQSIIEQFERARAECIRDGRNLAVWAPILGQYGPDLLVQAERASKLAHSFVEEWLTKYMFAGEADGPDKAKAAATWLSSHENFNSHGRHISRDELRDKGLKVDNLEDDADEQDIFLSIFHAATHTMSATAAVKIIENHLGRAYINQARSAMVPESITIEQLQPVPTRQPPQGPTRNVNPGFSRGGGARRR